ncbi:hypothetical protein D9M71_797970 [compost metagenome]
MQHRTLLIGGQQRGVECTTRSLLLCQQQLAVLNDGMAKCSLYLGRKAAFAIETLMLCFVRWGMVDQPVKGVVAILA